MATIILLSSVLDLFAKLNCFMQSKATDFSKLTILEGILSELKCHKNAEWCSLVETTVDMLASEHDIIFRGSST